MNWLFTKWKNKLFSVGTKGPFWAFDGIIYHKQGWLGCQLVSVEFKRQHAGTRRWINGYEMELFRTYRRGIWVEHAWSIVKLNRAGTIDEKNDVIQQFYKKLMCPIDHINSSR